MVCSRRTGVAPENPGSRRPMASGTISKAATPSSAIAVCQPKWLISRPSTGTIRNCPKEPAAAVMPMAQERSLAGMLRPITPYTTA